MDGCCRDEGVWRDEDDGWRDEVDGWLDEEDGWRDEEGGWRDGDGVGRDVEVVWRDGEGVGRDVEAGRAVDGFGRDDGVCSAGRINDILCGGGDGVCGGGAQSTDAVTVSGSNCATTSYSV